MNSYAIIAGNTKRFQCVLIVLFTVILSGCGLSAGDTFLGLAVAGGGAAAGGGGGGSSGDSFGPTPNYSVPPPQPTHPSPSNGELEVAPDEWLDWRGNRSSRGYLVYFDEFSPPTTLIANTSDTTINTGLLVKEKWYHWRVDAYNESGVNMGEEWSFKTCRPWEQKSTFTKPTARAAHCMVFDSNRGVTVLFGGWDGNQVGDTWEYDGNDWTQVAISGPPARSSHAMAYDSGRGVTVMYGGWTGNIALDDTWEYDNGNWTRIWPPNIPTERDTHSLVYDKSRSVCILYGGLLGDQSLNGETWEYNGTDWYQRWPITSPKLRRKHAMAYDSTRSVVFMFSGEIPDNLIDNALWEWDGADWTERFPGTRPIPRDGASMAFDTVRRIMVLYGGWAQDVNGETWEYDGFDWHRNYPSVAPPPLERSAMVYDFTRDRMVMFGGMTDTGDMVNDTWER